KAVQKEIQDKQSELLRLSQEKDDVGFAKKKKEVEALRASFKEHPLFKNYQAAHEELQEFLVEVKGVLS
ncbi:MAG: YlbF family regulator, partial [Bacilli bacterium]|nr:YlbF family regulator [Bacilli bacterium]